MVLDLKGEHRPLRFPPRRHIRRHLHPDPMAQGAGCCGSRGFVWLAEWREREQDGREQRSSQIYMYGRARIFAFGAVSGLIWSAIAGVILHLSFGSLGATVATLLSGILVGILLSIALVVPLARLGRSSVFVLGLLSLPLGVFLFGIIISLVALLAGESYADVRPLETSLVWAFYSVASYFALFLIPLAILTTYLLRRLTVPK